MAIAFWWSAFSKAWGRPGGTCRISIALGFAAPPRSTLRPRPAAGRGTWDFSDRWIDRRFGSWPGLGAFISWQRGMLGDYQPVGLVLLLAAFCLAGAITGWILVKMLREHVDSASFRQIHEHYPAK